MEWNNAVCELARRAWFFTQRAVRSWFILPVAGVRPTIHAVDPRGAGFCLADVPKPSRTFTIAHETFSMQSAPSSQEGVFDHATADRAAVAAKLRPSPAHIVWVSMLALLAMAAAAAVATWAKALQQNEIWNHETEVANRSSKRAIGRQ
jgi:pimeloyl-ACP methyl ester carboxylesterase